MNYKNRTIMKSWKEYPQLFIGKFKVKTDSRKNPLPFTGLYKVEGSNEPVIRTGVGSYNVSGCTLIARRIEDMTDDETKNCPTYKDNDITPIEEMRYRLYLWTYSNPAYDEMPARVQNYLLSIGVYPGPQSHFETGEVIDIKTI